MKYFWLLPQPILQGHSAIPLVVGGRAPHTSYNIPIMTSNNQTASYCRLCKVKEQNFTPPGEIISNLKTLSGSKRSSNNVPSVSPASKKPNTAVPFKHQLDTFADDITQKVFKQIMELELNKRSMRDEQPGGCFYCGATSHFKQNCPDVYTSNQRLRKAFDKTGKCNGCFGPFLDSCKGGKKHELGEGLKIIITCFYHDCCAENETFESFIMHYIHDNLLWAKLLAEAMDHYIQKRSISFGGN